MAKLIIVVDKSQDWAPFYQYDGVMTLPEYLKWSVKNKQRTRVINLCRQSSYLGTGYYCSLLAEARNHNVMPSVRAFSKFNRHEIADIAEEIPGTILTQLNKALIDESATQLLFNIYFGETEHKALKKVAAYLFEAFPVPILRVELQKKVSWQVKTLKIGSVHKLTEHEQTFFGNTLEKYSHKIWRVEPANKKYRYDLAVLVDPKEKFPPCTPKSLELFAKAARKAAMDTEQIGAKDIHRLAEFDGLFIRETTGVNHHTFHMALKAEREALSARRSDDFIEPRISEIEKELALLSHNRQVEILEKRDNEDLYLKDLAEWRQEAAQLKGIKFDSSQLRLVRLDQQALEPLSAVKPKKKLVIVLGLGVGLMLGVFVALLRLKFQPANRADHR